MQANVEDAIKIIRNLPVEDFDKIRKVLEEEENAKQTDNGKQEKPDRQIERYKMIRRWLDENSEKYLNQWVCLEGDKLIAHSKDGREVYQKAKEAGIENPFVHYIQEEPEAYWGGWL